MIDKKVLTGIVAAVGASLCCITPVLAVLAGSTGLASSFSWMEPFRPYLIVLTVLVLTYAWWDQLKPKKQDIECACEPDNEGKISFWHTKMFLAFVTLFSAVMLSFPYWGDTLIKREQPTVLVDKTNLFKVTIQIEGMTCKGCEAAVERVALETDGVVKIKVSSEEEQAVVEFDKSKTDIDSIMRAIGTTGYKPTSYTDNTGTYQAKEIKTKEHKSTTFKCSGGKCSADKCGNAK